MASFTREAEVSELQSCIVLLINTHTLLWWFYRKLVFLQTFVGAEGFRGRC